MRLFLVSLAILFGSSLIGYVAIRLLVVDDPLDIPGLPRGLWLSTLVLVASSGTLQMALVAARDGRLGRLRGGMTATTLLGFVFLLSQIVCWIQWSGPMKETLAQSPQAYLLTSFYVLTGLHAVHVIGGLVPLMVVTSRAWAGRYSADYHPGVVYCAMYWHFLDAVWLVLFATLMLGS